MQHLIDGVRDAVAKESWYAALTLALTLPDACAAIDSPGRGGNKRRYIAWLDAHVTRFVTEGARAYLSSREIYELRCAFLHAADLAIDDGEPAHPDSAEAMFEVLHEVILVVSETGIVPTRGLREDSTGRRSSYTVDVKVLCEWLCRAAESWLGHARLDPSKSSRIDGRRRIQRLTLDPFALTPI